MNRLGLPIILVFVVFAVVDWVGHGMMDFQMFKDSAELWRQAGPLTYTSIYLGYLALAVLFCLVYSKGYEGRGAGEGLRFGMWMALLVYLPNALIAYGHYKMGPRAAAADFLVNVVACLVAGWVLGATYKGPAVRATAA